MTRRLLPRFLVAPNAGPFTLDGTRTYLVGDRVLVILDPGPTHSGHREALIRASEGAREVRIVLTHAHSDHSALGSSLAAALGAPVFGPPSAAATLEAVPPAEGSSEPGDGMGAESAASGRPAAAMPPFRALEEGDRIPTDWGELVAVATPGHTRDHLAFWWPRGDALFVGDLLLGEGSTTWLGEYRGCVADYLDSLAKVKKFRVKTLYPSHGPPLEDPDEAVDRFVGHRLHRLAQLREALSRNPQAGVEDLVRAVYGMNLPPKLEEAARASVEVMLHHIAREGGGAAGFRSKG